MRKEINQQIFGKKMAIGGFSRLLNFGFNTLNCLITNALRINTQYLSSRTFCLSNCLLYSLSPCCRYSWMVSFSEMSSYQNLKMDSSQNLKLAYFTHFSNSFGILSKTNCVSSLDN